MTRPSTRPSTRLPVDVRAVLASFYPGHERRVFEVATLEYAHDYPIAGRHWCSGGDLRWTDSRALAGLPADAPYAVAYPDYVEAKGQRYYPLPVWTGYETGMPEGSRVGAFSMGGTLPGMVGYVLVVPNEISLTPALRDSLARTLWTPGAYLMDCAFWAENGVYVSWPRLAARLGEDDLGPRWTPRKGDLLMGDRAGPGDSKWLVNQVSHDDARTLHLIEHPSRKQALWPTVDWQEAVNAKWARTEKHP